MTRKRRGPGAALRDETGVSAIEFALVAPIFCFILVGVLEFGNLLFQRFELDAALAAGANYALVKADDVTAAGAPTLAANIEKVINAKWGKGWADSTVTINNGSSVTTTSGTTTAGGTAANASSCYCPSGSAKSLVWGAAVACGAACTGGGEAGKFVLINLSMPYTPILTGYGIVDAGAITVATLIQTEQ